MSDAPTPPSGGPDHRPTSLAEMEEFSSGGRRQIILLRGKWGVAVDRAFLWLTGYSLMTKQYAFAQHHPYISTLLLTTIGARTRTLRTTPLPYFRVGDTFVVRGSNGGGPTDPHWVHNVRANDHAWIRTGWSTRPARAHVATGEERVRLFETLCHASPTTKMYQDMCTPRELPLVVLQPWPPA